MKQRLTPTHAELTLPRNSSNLIPQLRSIPWRSRPEPLALEHTSSTSRTYNARRLFQVAANAELFLETLQHYRCQGEYRLHSFVVMPDHIHLLLTPTQTLERAMGLIKGRFSHRLASNSPVWQRSFTDHRIRDREDFEIRRTYIHKNPVRANLVEAAEQYSYSSAYCKPKAP